MAAQSLKSSLKRNVKSGILCFFELPPRSPKLNGHVERANRTHREEFYKVEEVDLSIEEHNSYICCSRLTHR